MLLCVNLKNRLVLWSGVQTVGPIFKMKGIRGRATMDLMYCMTSLSKHFMIIMVSAIGW